MGDVFDLEAALVTLTKLVYYQAFDCSDDY